MLECLPQGWEVAGLNPGGILYNQFGGKGCYIKLIHRMKVNNAYMSQRCAAYMAHTVLILCTYTVYLYCVLILCTYTVYLYCTLQQV